ncbi:unnamed protein product [Toxocara canis]|uniref:Uncharacterized protein n=1 Tax=Toxocara canis TaxID=6265 RepID=A0A3P7HCE4_TOXCA|nr:unnamed protein product [Toxocara canis]
MIPFANKFQFITPWERRANVFCRIHSATRNCCCAAATAARSCFAIFFALREILQLPFEEISLSFFLLLIPFANKFQFITPWERRANVFCRMHSATRNCCCAAATAARSCFAIFFALREILQLPFGD